jgi:hypothetical protein
LSLALGEEHRLRVLQNRMLRRIFGSKKNKVTGGWRKLLIKELHNLYSSQSVVRIIKPERMGETCILRGKDNKCIHNFGRKTLRIPRRRLEDNIKINLKETVSEDVVWINLIQDRV